MFRRLCHSDSQIDLISSVIHEEDDRVDYASSAEPDWSPVSSDDFDMLQARDLVSPLGSILSHDFSVSSLQSSQPTRHSTFAERQCVRRRVISRQYSLPVMTADIFGSSLMSSMPNEWIHSETDGDDVGADNNSTRDVSNNNADSVSNDNEAVSEDVGDNGTPPQPRQSSISKRKRLSRSLSDTDLNAQVTARWAQEPIDMFIPAPGDLANAEHRLEDQQPPPPYQEGLRTGEMDFSFLDALYQGSVPSSRVGTNRNEIYELP